MSRTLLRTPLRTLLRRRLVARPPWCAPYAWGWEGASLHRHDGPMSSMSSAFRCFSCNAGDGRWLEPGGSVVVITSKSWLGSSAERIWHEIFVWAANFLWKMIRIFSKMFEPLFVDPKNPTTFPPNFRQISLPKTKIHQRASARAQGERARKASYKGHVAAGSPILGASWGRSSLEWVRRMSETPTTTTQKSIEIHIQCVLQSASNLYCSAFGAPTLWRREILSGLLPFVSQCASHLYCSTPPFRIAVLWVNRDCCGHRDVQQWGAPWITSTGCKSSSVQRRLCRHSWGGGEVGRSFARNDWIMVTFIDLPGGPPDWTPSNTKTWTMACT